MPSEGKLSDEAKNSLNILFMDAIHKITADQVKVEEALEELQRKGQKLLSD